MALAFVLACVPQAQPGSPAAPSTEARPQTARSISVALLFEPDLLEPSRLNVSREIAAVSNAFLTIMTPTQESRPYLSTELPTIEKGTWKVLADGRMETTYTLRADAKWQDGAPVTAHDFAFAHQARMDPAFPAQRARD